MEHDGNGWVHCDLGHRHWGRYGAAGLLIIDRRPSAHGPLVLLQHRASWTANGDTWGIPGGARDSHETPGQAALREAGEEAGVVAEDVEVVGLWHDDHEGWEYVTVVATAVRDIEVRANAESAELRWVVLSDVEMLPLHSGFARTWPLVRGVYLAGE